MQFYITPYGIRWGASPGAAFYYPAIMNGVSFFGRFIIGILADRKLGFFNSLAIFDLCTSIIAFNNTTTKRRLFNYRKDWKNVFL